MLLTLCGDVSIRDKNAAAWENGTVESLFGGVQDVFHQSDRVVVNLECALTDSTGAIEKFGPNLKGTPRLADILKDAGITECGLSNNHIFDFGIKGLEDTLQALDRVGIRYAGVGANEEDSRKDLIIDQDGKRIRIVTVCEHEYSYALPDIVGARPYDPYDTNDDIRKSKEDADYVIVMYHGGKEQCRYPSPRLRKLCRSMVHNGADLVLCQHSHCIGCYEDYQGAKIVYGQGNFHFLSPDGDDMWNQGMAVQVELTDEVKISYIPVIANKTGIRLATDAEKEEILQAYEDRSKELLNGKWLDGWHEFCESKRPVYEAAIAGFHTGEYQAVQLFGHYLDCEAHTDVWRELYKTVHGLGKNK